MRKKYQDLIWKNLKNLPKLTNKYLRVLFSAYTNKTINSPISVAITLSWRCNANCIMCDFPKRANHELTTQEAKNMIDELAEMKVTGLTFYGGEPLLRKDLFELIKYAKQKGLIVHVPTNGYLLNFKKIFKLLDSEVDTIAVSIDAMNNKHDNIRNLKGCFNKAVKGIKNLRNTRDFFGFDTKITMISTITNQNIEQVPQLIILAEHLKTDGISIIPAQEVETIKNKLDNKKFYGMILWLLEQKLQGREIIDDSIPFLKYMLKKYKNKSTKIKCFAPHTDLHIDPQGNVYPCVYFLGMNKNFGNIKNKSIEDFWFSKEYGKTRKKLKNCQLCDYMCHKELSLPFNKLWFKR